MDQTNNSPALALKARWAIARITFIGYIVLSVVTLVGGFLTAPVMTWYFFGDWRFWRHLKPGLGLLPHGLKLMYAMLVTGKSFMFGVPLTAPPQCAPDPGIARRRADWPHGHSCGDCADCCKPLGHACPLLSTSNGHCLGFGSFYWRYFNCGRFPSVDAELDFYGCRKWVLVAPPVYESTDWVEANAIGTKKPAYIDSKALTGRC